MARATDPVRDAAPPVDCPGEDADDPAAVPVEEDPVAVELAEVLREEAVQVPLVDPPAGEPAPAEPVPVGEAAPETAEIPAPIPDGDKPEPAEAIAPPVAADARDDARRLADEDAVDELLDVVLEQLRSNNGVVLKVLPTIPKDGETVLAEF